jgi:molecular chaperone GrpE
MSKKKPHQTTVEAEPESTLDLDQKTEETTIDPMDQLKMDMEQLNDKYLRLNAEFQNYRKRVEKEKSDIFKYGQEKFMIEMLPIMDNFERALLASEQENTESKVVDGVVLIKKSLDEFFERNGVKKIEAVGMPFDPIKHHAVMTVESEDHSSDHVVEVFQDGYVLNDKVIRPCMVKVAH